MTDPALALRATSDALLADISRLADLERAKRHLKPGDRQLVEVSTEIELIADRVLRRTTEERALTEDAAAMVELGVAPAPDESIEQTPSVAQSATRSAGPTAPPRPIQAILDEWREAERRAGEALPGSPEGRLALADTDRLKQEYHRAYRAAHDAGESPRREDPRPVDPQT